MGTGWLLALFFVRGLSAKVHGGATDEGTQIFVLAIGGLLGLRINITGTISNVNPEGGIWKLKG